MRFLKLGVTDGFEKRQTTNQVNALPQIHCTNWS